MVRLLIAFIILSSHFCTFAAQQKFVSQTQQTQLIELYTSQGCSSCPPADEWLTTFVNNDRLWSEVVPINFHVDYWDNLGWPDRYASPNFSKRQRLYKSLGYSRTVGTPGFIINGRGWAGWFYGLKKPKYVIKDVGILEVIKNDNDISVLFTPTASYSIPLNVNVAQLGFGLFDSIKRGENRGKLLRHDFVALSYQQSTLLEDNNRYSGSLTISSPDVVSAVSGIAVWITQGNDPVPIQSIGGFIR